MVLEWVFVVFLCLVFFLIYDCFYFVVVTCSIFFFSSRRRHTRLQGDWSSDVCSSDLAQEVPLPSTQPRRGRVSSRSAVARSLLVAVVVGDWSPTEDARSADPPRVGVRSEERRVGKEGRGGQWPERETRRGAAGAR